MKIVNYDGKRVRHLKYDVDAMIDAETISGKGFGEVAFNPALMAGFVVLRGYIWAGLKHEDPDLTLKDTSAMLTVAIKNNISVGDIVSDIKEAWYECGLAEKPASKMEKKDNPDNPNAETEAAKQ